MSDFARSSINSLPEELQKRLRGSWAGAFYREFFVQIDEEAFAVLYSDELSGLEIPVRDLLGLEALKSGFGWSDEETHDQFAFDVRVRFALGHRDLSKGHPELRTVHGFRERFARHMQETGENLIERALVQVADEQIAALGLEIGKLRIDSTLIAESIRQVVRLQLLVEVLQRVFRLLDEEDRQRYADLFAPYLDHSPRRYTYRIRGGGYDEHIQRIGELMCRLLEELPASYADEPVYQVLQAVFNEHFVVEGATLRPKEGEALSDSSLRPPDDWEAIYRQKSGDSRVGHVADAAETEHPDGPSQSIVGVQTKDAALLAEAPPDLKERVEACASRQSSRSAIETTVRATTGILLRAWAVLIVTIKRLLSQRWLALATTLGLVASVALTVSIPLYTDAVYYHMLWEDLAGGQFGTGATRPPFTYMFRYIGDQDGPVEWDDLRQVDAYLAGSGGTGLGLDQDLLVRFFRTEYFRVFPPQDSSYASSRHILIWLGFGFASGLENHITVVEGSFPVVASPAEDSTVEVLVSEDMALELGLQVGELYIALAQSGTIQEGKTTPIPVRIAGIWRAIDPEDPFWFYKPDVLKEVMFVPEETFVNRISAYMEDEVNQGVWYLVMDGSDIHVDDVIPLLVRANVVQQRVAGLLPGTQLSVSPIEALQRYRGASGLLTVLLTAFSVPILGLILAFVGLVVGLSVGRRRNEIAVLRSRGATAIQVVGIAALEGALLGAVALIVGLVAGGMIAQLIGRARSFLDFTLESGLRVALTTATLRFGAVAAGVALLAQVVPTVAAARHTVVTYKRERARDMQRPWWQRAWLDVLLLVPAAYGIYLLRKQGSIALPLGDGTYASDPFQNPLLFLVPALGGFALTLVILRILPPGLSGIAWIASRTRGVGFLLAARHLSRTPGFYAAPLALLILTLSLSAFTASLAQTLDRHLYDQMYYEVGADMRLVESGRTAETGTFGGAFDGGGSTAGEEEEKEAEGPRWLFLPVSEYLKATGVQAAARAGEYDVFTQLSGGSQNGKFIGTDRCDFAQVAFWRDDFAPASLGALMNALAVHRDGVLASRSFLARHGLNMGDVFRLGVRAYGEVYELDVKVVGTFDLFPSWYPEEDGPLFVGNLDYFFEQAGWQFPYDVWLKTEPNADYDRTVGDLQELGLRTYWNAPLLKIASEQRQPERQGLFGLLSVGFVAAALLTVLGFLLYAFFSFRRRFIEMGILRAIGLSSGQMAVFLAWELVFLLLVGLVAGTGLGVWMSRLFIPYLQVGADASAQIPPFVVLIAWPAIIRIYALFGLLFVVALGGLTALLLRMRIFQAVKLGETT